MRQRACMRDRGHTTSAKAEDLRGRVSRRLRELSWGCSGADALACGCEPARALACQDSERAVGVPGVLHDLSSLLVHMEHAAG